MILDATAGFRMIWFDKNHKDTIYLDCRSDEQLKEDLTFVPNRRPWNPIVKTLKGDFRNLPFANDFFDLIVFDPSHLIKCGKNGVFCKKYGKLNVETWQKDLIEGILEIWRVLKINGILIFKWNTFDIPLKDVLSLFPIEPLFGQKTSGTQYKGKRKAKTFWFCFMKENN